MNVAAIILQDTSKTVAAPLSFTVPLADLCDFASRPEKRRNEVQVTLKLLERVHTLRAQGNSLEAAVTTVAAGARHLMRGCSPVTLRRKYDTYLASGGKWTSLVAGYKGPSSLPNDFVQLVKKFAEDNHRSMAEAFELLRQQWQLGHPITGYGTWFEYYALLHPTRPLPKSWPRNFYPAGWSTRNLYRKAPNKGARVLFQRGLFAAKKHFPSLKRDPSGLRPLELIVIDDFELDCLCVFPGSAEHKAQIGRVAGLLAMDVASRRKLHWGIGQRLERIEEQPDGTTRTVRTGISRVDVQHLLHGLFAKYGLPEYTVTILCENASAAISAELELALSTLFEGRVKISRTGLIDHKTLTNGFCEKGGKPFEKGWIESAFNSLWNKLGSMHGYKGSIQRLNGPADLDAKIAYTKLLIGQGEKSLNLPPEKIALLRLPFPSPHAVEQAFAWACAAADANTKHRYLGFDRVTEFVLAEDTDPVPFSALALLPEASQQLAQPVERMESSIERWSRLAAETTFAAIPQSVLALLLLTPKKITYRNHALTFSETKTGGYTYVDRDGTVLRDVADGTEFLCYFDRNAPELLHVADLNGAYVGTLPRLGGRSGLVDIRDKTALAEAGALQAAVVNRAIAEVRERHADQNDQLAADKAHNDAVVAQHKTETAPLTKAEKIGQAATDAAMKAYRSKTTAAALQATAEIDASNLL